MYVAEVQSVGAVVALCDGDVASAVDLRAYTSKAGDSGESCFSGLIVTDYKRKMNGKIFLLMIVSSQILPHLPSAFFPSCQRYLLPDER